MLTITPYQFLLQGTKLMLISDCYLGFEKEYCIEEIVKSQEMETGI